MLTAVICLSILCSCLLGSLLFCMVRIAALVEHVEKLGTQVELSLDVLDGAYDRIARSAGQEVLADDMFVRQVVSSLLHAKQAVHEVAVLLASFGDVVDEEPDRVYDDGDSQQ